MIGRRFVEVWHRIDAIVGAFLVLGATFGGGMAVQGLIDSNERAGLYTQIEKTRSNAEASCSDRMLEMQKTYVDPGGPTQRLIDQLKGRVEEQSKSLDSVRTSCEKAAQVSKDTQSKVAAPARAAIAAATTAATNAAQKQVQETTRQEVNNAIINRKLKKP